MSDDFRQTLIDAGFANARDPIVFFRDILGIDPNPAQERWFSLLRPIDGWRWPYRDVVHVAANQIGKSLGMGGIILWACANKIGVPLPTSEEGAAQWASAPYSWAHLAPSQQQAYIVWRDINLIIKNAHPAQRRPCKLVPPLVNDVKIEHQYEGLEFFNGATAQFRTTEDKAKAILGRRFNGVSVDEAAFEDNLSVIYYEVLEMRVAAAGGPILLISTPNGINDFYDFVSPIRYDGDQIAGRTWRSKDGLKALVWSDVSDNVGFGLTQEAVDIIASSDVETKDQQLHGAFLEPSEAFFTPTTDVLKAFRPYPHEQAPLDGHKYVIFWDPSVASDPTAAVVLDVTDPGEWIGVWLDHRRRPPSVEQLIVDMMGLHARYNSGGARAITGYDATSMGGAMLKQAIAGIVPQQGLNLAGPSQKINVLTNLRAALMQRRLVLPEGWLNAKREILNYRLKDDKIRQDIVMALAGAAHIAASGFTGAQSRPFSVSGRVTNVRG